MSVKVIHTDGPPTAWSYEIAKFRDGETGQYSGWVRRITPDRPDAPKGSVRALTPLYAGEPEPD